MLGSYILLLVIIMVVVAYVLPNIFNDFFITEKRNNLEKTREIISEVLSERNFRTDPEAQSILETAASAAEVISGFVRR